MKRSAALAGLSRDHHHALEAALRLTRARPETLDDALKHFHEFFEARGARHFELEEAILLPALPASEPGWPELCDRVLAEHADLRARGAEAADVSAAHELGRRLHDHVRFEERELFEVLEARLGREGLSQLALRLEQ